MTRAQKLRKHLEGLVRRDLRAASVNEDALRKRIDEYYFPIFQWTEELVDATQTRAATSSKEEQRKPPCVCIGLSCVQGGGKTTIVRYLEEMLAFTGKRCAVVSLDDVYLERTKQVELAAANPENPLLQVPITLRTLADTPCVCMFGSDGVVWIVSKVVSR